MNSTGGCVHTDDKDLPLLWAPVNFRYIYRHCLSFYNTKKKKKLLQSLKKFQCKKKKEILFKCTMYEIYISGISM